MIIKPCKRHKVSVTTYLSTYKYNCNKVTEIAWKLTDSEAIQLFLGKCAYCGCKPSPTDPNGINRVINKQEYITLNCVSCCKICNVWKNALTKEEFLNHIQEVYKYNFNKS